MRIQFKRDYDQDIRLLKHGGNVFWYGLLVLAAFALPLVVDDYYTGEFTRVLIYAIAGLGLMTVTGFTGQVSLGHAAFLAIGAYTNAWMLSQGVSSLVAIPAAALVSLLFGLVVALPTSRMSGLYLAIATLGFAVIVEEIAVKWEHVTGGTRGFAVDPPLLFGQQMWEASQLYYLSLVILILCTLAIINLLRAPVGRAMIAVRESEVSARSLGVRVTQVKIFAFAVSAAITGMAGALFAHYLQFLAPEVFSILLSIQILLMVVVGGFGTVSGALIGAAFLGLLETGIPFLKDALPSNIGTQPGLEPLIFGVFLVIVILYEPAGIYGRWVKIRTYFETFPVYRRRAFKRQRSYLRTERMQ